MSDRTCSIEGCERPAKTRGWCNTHYNRWHRSGSPGEAFVPRTFSERMWSKIEKSPTGCWLWTGYINPGGYGQVVAGERRLAHRVFYEWLVESIPDGLDLDHLCRVRHCVNPAHLEPVTRRENLLRGETRTASNAAKTHCPVGHPYNDEHTQWYRGHRSCRTCQNDQRRARYIPKAERTSERIYR